MSDHLLALRDVAHSYRALPVLSDINWTTRPGQQWAVLGPNGAGKTTLAKLITGQLPCHTGNINIAANAQRIAYVCFEQQKALCDLDTKLDESEFRSDAQDPGTTVQAAILGGHVPGDQFREWVSRLGIAHLLDRGIRFISTGEMRKTLLLRAILSQPQLLILDNPLDGLDINSQGEMSRVLEQLLSDGPAVILLVRQPEDLPEGISHLLVLDEGRTVAAGKREEVMSLPEVLSLINPPPLTLGALPAAAARDYTIEEAKPLLQLHGVNVSFGDQHIIRDLDWTFERGQHCHIAGPNGCGKTTLLSLVNGDSHKAYGQNITLFGIRRGSGESVWDIKQKYGLLNTQLHLKHVRGMRAIEVVVSGFFDTVGLYDNWGDSQRQLAQHWLAALGLAEFEKAPFDTLSFGIQRMVLLARAMVKSPLILILDEPCLGLDAYHRRTILEAIDHIADNSDTQILYVSHTAGEVPACINQRLEFVPTDSGFECRVSP